MGTDVNVPCTNTHAGCYEIDGVGGGTMTFLELAYVVDAAELMGWGC